MKLLFCILHFRILGQTEENGYLTFLTGEMKKKKRLCVRNIIKDVVEASTRKSQVVFRLFVSCSAKSRMRLNNLKTCLRFPCIGLNTIIGSLVSNRPAQPQRLARVLNLASIGIILSRKRPAKVLIRMHGCACWSAPWLFAYGKNGFSHDVARLHIAEGVSARLYITGYNDFLFF